MRHARQRNQLETYSNSSSKYDEKVDKRVNREIREI